MRRMAHRRAALNNSDAIKEGELWLLLPTVLLRA